MLLNLLLMVLYLRSSDGLIELVTERGSHSREFRLTCRQLTSYIAIMEASFTPVIVTDFYNETIGARIFNVTSAYNNLQIVDGDFNVRLALNQRCSGKNHCSFVLNKDHPMSVYWGPGEIYIKYACMSEDYVTKFCNLELEIPEGGGTNAQGFIMSPGYPKFYIGQSECRWRIKASSPQRVEITLLDISLSASYGRGADGYCEDELSVYVDDLVLVNTCSEHEQPPVVLSENNVIEVKVVGRSGSLVTKRGILIYYRALECPTLSPPIDGYLVHRNTSAAEYMCCVGYVFPDTFERMRTLKCIHNAWDRTLPGECINIQNITQSLSPSVKANRKNMSETSHLVDVVIPSILIAGLLLGNAVVVFIIYKYKKRRTMDVYEEELNTMVANTNNVP